MTQGLIIFLAVFLGIILSNVCLHLYRQWSMKKYNEEQFKKLDSDWLEMKKALSGEGSPKGHPQAEA